MPEIAKSFKIAPKGRGAYSVQIDGQEFPWHLKAETIRIDATVDGTVCDLHVVYLPVFVEGAVEIVTDPADPTPIAEVQ